MIFVKLLLLASFAYYPTAKGRRVVEDTIIPYEQPAACECVTINGRRICNSACSGRKK